VDDARDQLEQSANLAMEQIVASAIMSQYLKTLDSIYGMYIDACCGFRLFGDKVQRETKGGPETDPRIFMGSFDDPNRCDATYHHSALRSEILGRNKQGGSNEVLLSQACLHFIFTVWDTTTRPNYAKMLGKDQKEIRSDIMGDIRFYRNDIAHNNGILQKPTVALKFFKVGEPINLSQTKMEEILVRVFDELAKLNEELTGLKINAKFARLLNR
jgi:hypothetical protein